MYIYKPDLVLELKIFRILWAILSIIGTTSDPRKRVNWSIIDIRYRMSRQSGNPINEAHIREVNEGCHKYEAIIDFIVQIFYADFKFI